MRCGQYQMSWDPNLRWGGGGWESSRWWYWCSWGECCSPHSGKVSQDCFWLLELSLWCERITERKWHSLVLKKEKRYILLMADLSLCHRVSRYHHNHHQYHDQKFDCSGETNEWMDGCFRDGWEWLRKKDTPNGGEADIRIMVMMMVIGIIWWLFGGLTAADPLVDENHIWRP